jgi:Fe-S-cluster-containing hydrogenase component 2
MDVAILDEDVEKVQTIECVDCLKCVTACPSSGTLKLKFFGFSLYSASRGALAKFKLKALKAKKKDLAGLGLTT